MVTSTTGQHFEYSEGESTTVAVVDAAATVRDTDPMDLSPLYEGIPADALNTLVSEGDDISVTFSYEGVRITVHSDRRIVVHELR